MQQKTLPQHENTFHQLHKMTPGDAQWLSKLTLLKSKTMFFMLGNITIFDNFSGAEGTPKGVICKNG